MFYPTDGSSNLLPNADAHLTNSWHHNPLTASELDPNSSPLHQSSTNAVTTCVKKYHTSKYTSPLSFIAFKFTSVLEAPHLLWGCTDAFISSQYM